MSEKHFIALADALIESKLAWSDEQYQVLADFCRSQNRQFNQDIRFGYIRGFERQARPNGGKR